MLELVGVVVTEAGSTRLNRCGFQCRAGEVLGLAGGTGAGKSTALTVAAGGISPTRGRVLLGGRDVTKRPGRLRESVALVTHELPGPYDVSVEKWLTLWSELDGVSKKDRARITTEIERFGITETLRPLAALSEGEKARVGLARAWIRQPSVCLLDAPAAWLDGDGLRRLIGAIRSAADDGRAVIVAGSTPHLVTAICERVVLLADGTVVGESARADEDFQTRVAAASGWAS